MQKALFCSLYSTARIPFSFSWHGWTTLVNRCPFSSSFCQLVGRLGLCQPGLLCLVSSGREVWAGLHTKWSSALLCSFLSFNPSITPVYQYPFQLSLSQSVSLTGLRCRVICGGNWWAIFLFPYVRYSQPSSVTVLAKPNFMRKFLCCFSLVFSCRNLYFISPHSYYPWI